MAILVVVATRGLVMLEVKNDVGGAGIQLHQQHHRYSQLGE